MAGGLQPPEEDEGHCAFATGGVTFVLEDCDLQVGKVGKVGPPPCALYGQAASLSVKVAFSIVAHQFTKVYASRTFDS